MDPVTTTPIVTTTRPRTFTTTIAPLSTSAVPRTAPVTNSHLVTALTGRRPFSHSNITVTTKPKKNRWWLTASLVLKHYTPENCQNIARDTLSSGVQHNVSYYCWWLPVSCVVRNAHRTIENESVYVGKTHFYEQFTKSATFFKLLLL